MKNFFEDKIDHKKLNELLGLGNGILRVLYILITILGLYAITLIFKEWKIIEFILTILSVLSPVIVGLIIAWLLDPLVKRVMKKGVSRTWATIIVYVGMLAIIYLLLITIFPMLIAQMNEFLLVLPAILDDISNWANHLLEQLRNISIIDVNAIRNGVSTYFDNIASSITPDAASIIIGFVGNIFGAIGSLFISLIIGLYMLFDFDNIDNALLALLPRRFRKDTRNLFIEANTYLFSYVKGTLLVSTLIFVLSTTAFALAGLKSPLLFGLICGITNVIPYLGPYLGGIPAVIVGFTQGIPTGILTVIAIFVIQTIEGNFIQPMVMSKSMKLHPVTIIIGLLVFGYFFGIVGMIISTPVMAILKSLLVFFDKKYNIIRGDK